MEQLFLKPSNVAVGMSEADYPIYIPGYGNVAATEVAYNCSVVGAQGFCMRR
jgi:hypothetical protein